MGADRREPTKMKEAAESMQERRYDIDGLRVLNDGSLVALLFVGWLAMFFPAIYADRS